MPDVLKTCEISHRLPFEAIATDWSLPQLHWVPDSSIIHSFSPNPVLVARLQKPAPSRVWLHGQSPPARARRVK
ncbi:hypothetical protein [Laspinema olomoucense]|uniref:Uncharacterized protein n=1 Tax=Laspinema olomoucense D3b TaxID=2953688 RepID=A0ABT2N8Y0_9CYAN|nr:hypothetical protein [Laspinema sp. D3b]MCT7979165.1 hypothetical protein [Laspinema sp. D3b]